MPIGNSSEWGLLDDIVSEHRTLLIEDRLILNPHDQDTFALTAHMSIPLQARNNSEWRINGKVISTGTEVRFTPTRIGSYEISAYDITSNTTEYITINITNPQ